MARELCAAIAEKIDHQVDRVLRMCSLVPADRAGWQPPIPRPITFGQLFTHLCECLAGFAATLQAARPAELEHLSRLKALLATPCASVADAADRLGQLRAAIAEGFGVLTDEDLPRRIPTVFVKEGEPILTLLLINLEHLASHKYQLFVYLRLAGVSVESRDLYHFSGA